MSCSCHALWQLAKQVSTHTHTHAVAFARFAHFSRDPIGSGDGNGHGSGHCSRATSRRKHEQTRLAPINYKISSPVWYGINTLIFDFSLPRWIVNTQYFVCFILLRFFADIDSALFSSSSVFFFFFSYTLLLDFVRESNESVGSECWMLDICWIHFWLFWFHFCITV